MCQLFSYFLFVSFSLPNLFLISLVQRKVQAKLMIANEVTFLKWRLNFLFWDKTSFLFLYLVKEGQVPVSLFSLTFVIHWFQIFTKLLVIDESDGDTWRQKTRFRGSIWQDWSFALCTCSFWFGDHNLRCVTKYRARHIV